jgi:undecaprenyl pyrophosphate phosphatase UppP
MLNVIQLTMNFIFTKNIMSQKSVSNNSKKVCRTCMVIRIFVIAMLVLVIVGLLAREQMSYLSFISTWNVAIAIMIFGILSFIIKFILWKLEEKKQTNDPLQND